LFKNELMNIVVISADRTTFAKSAAYLSHHGYKIRYIRDLAVALDLFTKVKPELVLLSWDLGAADAVSSFQKIQDELKIPCMVFSADPSPRATASLTRSRIPHVIFPPLNGPSIHRRVQLMIRNEASRIKASESKAEESVAPPKSYSVVKIKADEVPADASWGQAGPAEGGLQKWKAAGKSDGGKQFTYYSVGSEKPVYDNGLKQWKNLDQNATVLQGVSPEGDEELTRVMEEATFDEIQEQMKSEQNTKLIMEKAKSWIGAAAQSLPSDLKVDIGGTGDGAVLAIPVSKDGIKGYLVAGVDAPRGDRRVLAAFCAHMLNHCSREPGLAISVALEFATFQKWALANDFQFSEMVGGKQILMAFMPAETLPELLPIGNYLQTDLENWLVPESKLTFDVFVHMPANNKQIRYFKKDSVINEGHLHQYSRLGMPGLLIQEQDLLSFMAYCIELALGRAKG
jgi:hypothetical protein